MRFSLYRGLLLISLLSLIALIIALGSQHIGGMRPCAWCVLQRLIVIGIALMATLGALLAHRQAWAARALALVCVALSISGMLAAWHQYSVAAQQFSCARTLADRIITGSNLDAQIPWLFGIYASCMDARANLLGIDYALWALALFALLTTLGISAALSRPIR